METGTAEHSQPKWVLLLFYLWVAIVSTIVWSRLADIDNITQWHTGMIKGTLPSPTQFRPLISWLATILYTVVPYMDTPLSYFVLRIVFTSLALFFFDRYMRNWFSPSASMAGALCLASIIPFTYYEMIQESDQFNLLIFIASFHVLAIKKDNWLIPLILVGTFNREATAMIAAIYFLVRYKAVPLKQLIMFTLVLAMCWATIYFALVQSYGWRPYQCEVIQWQDNIKTLQPTIFVFLFYGILWILAVKNALKAPILLKRPLLLVPPYIILHYMVTIVWEVRLFLPLAPLIIPLAWFTFFPSRTQATVPE